MDDKSWLASKTIFFNSLVAVFAIIAEHTGLLREVLSGSDYFLMLVLVSTVNTGLRFITKAGLRL